MIFFLRVLVYERMFSRIVIIIFNEMFSINKIVENNEFLYAHYEIKLVYLTLFFFPPGILAEFTLASNLEFLIYTE